ncbi:TraR/DksA family transcriptional regulator [Rhizobium sp. KVB221]|uniref:TraR/DksA family transcriptional regulator n=1 Tax=Rhizobium setariae TaxID=2801340 RepID=A0A937CKY3_9HYPH|nr:TraR/DksA family transcriptional regulator [Rhizobium setariae]MBL0370986.1 TraR/DksA family transcriptional regulator [Rhizobium setariae]
MQERTDFETVLRARKVELEARLRRIEDDLDEPASADWSERAVELQDDEMLEGMGHAGSAELKAIDAALARLDKGTFGICPRCGGPVSEARLRAVPYAALCEDCIRGT